MHVYKYLKVNYGIVCVAYMGWRNKTGALEFSEASIKEIAISSEWNQSVFLHDIDSDTTRKIYGIK